MSHRTHAIFFKRRKGKVAQQAKQRGKYALEKKNYPQKQQKMTDEHTILPKKSEVT